MFVELRDWFKIAAGGLAHPPAPKG